MKKIISILVSIAMLLPAVCVNTYAEDFPGEETLFYTDFEDESKTYADLGFDGSGSKAYVAGESGNGITPALVDGNFTYLERHLGFAFSSVNGGKKLDAGTYHTRFSYNSFGNAARNDFYIANGTSNSAYKELVLSTETLNSYGNQWVEIDLEFTIPTLKWNITLTPQDGEVYTGGGTYTNSSNAIPALNWWIKPVSNFKNTTPPTIDNFYVTKELKNSELADDALKIVNSAGDAIDSRKVPVTGAFVTIDFGSEAVALGVSPDYVEITDVNKQNTIDYFGYCDGSVWIMELSEVLNYGTAYTVSVKEGIPDGFGMEIEPKSFEFSTIENTVSGLFYDFEDESKTYADLGFEASGSKAYVPGKEGNGITAALVSGNFTYLQRHMGFALNAQSDGTYKVKYDFNAGEYASENAFYFARGTGSSAPKSIIFDTTDLNTFGDSWVKVELEFSVPSLEWKATITPEEGDAIEKTGKYTESSTNGVAALQWWITPVSNFLNYTPPVIDNMEVTAEYDNPPAILNNNIAFYAGETKQEITAVGIDADKVVVDFGQMLNTEDLTTDNFIIRKKDGGTEIPVGISYKGFNEVTLNIIPKTLEKNTEYELQIGNIRNVSGQYIGGTSIFDFFVAGGGKKSATVKKIIKDNKAVLNASGLTAGKAMLYADCQNVSKLGLIALYYNGDSFVSAEFSECNVTEDGNIGIEFKITDEAFDKAEFILTDGFDSLKPLSEKTVLKDELSVGEGLTVSKNIKETDFEVKRNTGTDIITISGEADAEDTVIVFVVSDQPVNAVMIKADENGNFSTDLKLSVTDEYKAFAVGANDEKNAEGLNFEFTVFSEYKEAIDEIMSAQNEDEFVILTEANKTALGIEKMYSESAAGLYYKEFKNVIDNVNYDYEKNQSDFMRSYLIDALNKGQNVDASEYIERLYSDNERICTYLDKYVTSAEEKAFFTDMLTGKNIGVSERKENMAFDDELKAATDIGLVLTGIKYADGPDEAKNILSDFNDILGINTLSSVKAVYNQIRGKSFLTIDELKQAYSKALSATQGSGSGNGGGGGGGSSSGGSGGSQYIEKTPVESYPAQVKDPEAVEAINIKFEDLDSVDWAYTDISELYEKGIISGVSEARFNPLGEVKREQFIKMIVCAMGMENYESEYASFSDVPQGAWFEKYVSIAKQYGLVSGIGNNMFGTDQNISRQDMAVMIYNAMCKKGFKNSGAQNDFADSALCADYANVAIAELSALEIITGVGENLYDPTATATRAQAAVIINRALKYLN